MSPVKSPVVATKIMTQTDLLKNRKSSQNILEKLFQHGYIISRRILQTLVERSNNSTKSSHLSYMQSDCCKPPIDCGFLYKNDTFWIRNSNSGPVMNDIISNCNKWSNDQTKRCYDDIKEDWILLAVALGFLLLIWSSSCFMII
ncbi:protein TORNADO 2-like [Tripterygium wilfordii]|uniref:protein TORNADO 2-like n=1 Tax=Tripterygium wilfordii TaxID=458696 RepID=UPI0018F7FF32|nr:protein TORNADO 2-like [Tripterygium wilfordii]